MNSDLHRFALGEIMPGWTGPRPEQTALHADSSGLMLLHCYRTPTAAEIQGARAGKVRFALVPAGTHTLFLLYDVHKLTNGWCDAPFALGLVPEGRGRIAPRKEHEGRLLMSVLVDAGTGKLRALRAISLTPDFSNSLDRLLESQAAALGTFTRAAHDHEIRAAYARWPDTATMLSAAIAVERGGIPF